MRAAKTAVLAPAPAEAAVKVAAAVEAVSPRAADVMDGWVVRFVGGQRYEKSVSG